MSTITAESLVTLTADAAELFVSHANRIMMVVDTRGTRHVAYKCAQLALINGRWQPDYDTCAEFYADDLVLYRG